MGSADSRTGTTIGKPIRPGVSLGGETGGAAYILVPLVVSGFGLMKAQALPGTFKLQWVLRTCPWAIAVLDDHSGGGEEQRSSSSRPGGMGSESMGHWGCFCHDRSSAGLVEASRPVTKDS